MKYLYLVLTILFSINAFAAIPSTTVWEFRSTATGGAMVNGCGYDSATAGATHDYTQQNGAGYALTGVTSSGAGNTVLTASAASDMIGNFTRVVSGTNFTLSWFRVTGVSPGVSITFDTNAAGTSISTGVGASGVMNVGGACIFGSATLDSLFFAQPVGGNVIWFTGNMSTGSAIAAGTAGGASTPIILKGYASNRNDNPKGSTRPLITLGTTAFNLANNVDVYYMSFTGSGTGNVLATGTAGKIFYTKTVNTNTSGTSRNCLNLGSNAQALGVESLAYRGTGIITSGNNTVIGSYVHDSDVLYLNSGTAAATTLMFNIFENPGTAAIKFSAANTSAMTIANNTLIGGGAAGTPVGIGLSMATGVTAVRFVNNIIAGFTTGVSHADTQTTGFDDCNAYYNNTADVSAAGQWQKGANDISTNPGFANEVQYHGTTATSATTVLTDSGANFANVVDNQDYVIVISATGATLGTYPITSHTATTLTSSATFGTGSSINYNVLTGHNAAVAPTMKFKGCPGAFPGAFTTGYMDIGAAQRHEYGRQIGK